MVAARLMMLSRQIIEKNIDVGQQIAYQHQFGRNWDAVSVGKDKNEDRNERDDLSQS
jgi:hypothetical protein